MLEFFQSLFQWITVSPASGWVAAFIATLAYLRSRNQTRPKKILVRQQPGFSFIDVWPGLKKQIKILYGDKQVKSLHQFNFSVVNEGSEVIENPRIFVIFPEETIVLDIELLPQDLKMHANIDRNKVTILIPYLNSFREHSHVIKASAMLDGNFSGVQIKGSGVGWSVYYQPIPTFDEARSQLSKILMVFAIVLSIYFYCLETTRNISSGVSWGWKVLPGFLIIVVFTFIGYKYFRRLLVNLDQQDTDDT